jgi:hypothetical protein
LEAEDVTLEMPGNWTGKMLRQAHLPTKALEMPINDYDEILASLNFWSNDLE